ncbi:MAG: hypothetical protein Q4G42_03645 [Neisseria sp.]|nr:hypothetical protein [Neisseria sp.]
MIGRVIRVAFVLMLVAFVVHRLVSREHKHTIHEWVRVTAVVLVITAAVLLLWRMLQYWLAG